MKFKKSLGAFLVPLLSILLAFVIGGFIMASLGAERFSRDTRGVSRTPAGQLLFDGAQELLRLAGELEGKVRNTGGKI